MSTAFHNSLFFDLLKSRAKVTPAENAILGGITGSSFALSQKLADLPIVVFDFETTGLDVKTARITEIGAIKFKNRCEIDRISTLVNPQIQLSPEVMRITGLSNEMLAGAPPLVDVMHDFHDFLRGCVGVAHNAEFDCHILAYESARFGIQCSYTVLCTLKMARSLVDLPKRNLDALAEHYELQFESRHRSIGDILVTAGVLWKMLDENPEIVSLHDLQQFLEPVPKIQ